MYVSRRLWADYFDAQGVQYAFFSAANAVALQEARRQALVEAEAKEALHDGPPDGLGRIVAQEEEEEDLSSEEEEESKENYESQSESEDEGLYLSEDEHSSENRDLRAKVLSVLELEDLFVKAAPDLSSESSWPRMIA
jgi:large subunit GTPase 1